MKHRRHPAVGPAAGLFLGSALTFEASYRPLWGFVLLVVLGGAARTGWGRLVAWTAVGLLNASVFWVQPPAGEAFWEVERPVELTVSPRGSWRRFDGGWTLRARVKALRQEPRHWRYPLTVLVSVPGREPPPLGSVYRLKGYLKPGARYHNPGALPAGPRRLWLKSRRFLVVERLGPWRALTQRLRQRLLERLEAALAGAVPQDRGGLAVEDAEGDGKGQGSHGMGEALLRALVLGDRSHLPAAWIQGLRRTGLAHLLSVSGLHVGLLVGLAWFVARRLPPALRVAASLAALGVYLLLVGPRPSLLRASVMALALLGGRVLERRPQALNGLGLAVMLLLLHDATLVQDLGFCLTVSATAGVLVLGPLLARRWSPEPPVGQRRAGTGGPSWWIRPLAASVGAQVLSLPWSLPRFHLLTPLAPLFNLVAVAWTGWALCGCLLWSGVSLACPALGSRLVFLLDGLAWPFSWPRLLPPAPWLALPLSLGPLESALLAGGLFAALWWIRLGAWAPALALWVWLGVAPPEPAVPELLMLDVGQGDAIVLRDGAEAILVDGGGSRGGDFAASVLLPALTAQGIRRLDAVVMTHPDLDHCGGLVDLVGYLPVDELWMAPGWPMASCAGTLSERAQVPIRKLSKGAEVGVGRWWIRALHPPPGRLAGRNADSLVLLAAAVGRRVLLTGDIDRETEAGLGGELGVELRCDILKVAHHGSKSSTGEWFLAVTRPRVALISAGSTNAYGHPSATVLRRLRDHRILVLRTDRSGLIRLTLPPGGPMAIRVGAEVPTVEGAKELP